MKLTPLEYNVVVEIDPPQEKTSGGIFLPEQTKDRDKLAGDRGTLIAISPMAFNFPDWPEGEAKPIVGNRVLVARYAGVVQDEGGKVIRVLKDKDIIALIEEE